MDDPYTGAILVAIGLTIGCVITALNFTAEVNGLKAQAIERGYALYCPTNGDWAWKGECKDVNNN